MIFLAIDTSGRRGSIALARGQQDECHLLETVPLVGGTFSAELVPQISALLSKHKVGIRDIGAYAVGAGPGSFTGLRIGLAAVKGFADALGKPIVAVSLLEACVFTSGAEGKVVAALDAGRGDVYVGEYELPEVGAEGPKEYILSKNEFMAKAQGWKLVTPDAALASACREADLAIIEIPAGTAETVARLGWRKLRWNKTVTPEQLEANYIRRTDAEMLAKMGS